MNENDEVNLDRMDIEVTPRVRIRASSPLVPPLRVGTLGVDDDERVTHASLSI